MDASVWGSEGDNGWSHRWKGAEAHSERCFHLGEWRREPEEVAATAEVLYLASSLGNGYQALVIVV